MAEKLGNTQAEVSGADKTHEKSDIGKAFAELFSKDNIGKAFTELFFKDNDEESTLFIKTIRNPWSEKPQFEYRREGPYPQVKTGGSAFDVWIHNDKNVRHNIPHEKSISSLSDRFKNNSIFYPVIEMDHEDKKKTGSFGNSHKAHDYITKQTELVEQGKFREAVQMDIDDIHEKFGDKYDAAIGEMLEYIDELEKHEII